MGWLASVLVVVLLGTTPAAGIASGTQGPAEALPAISLPPALDRVLRDYESAWRAGNGPLLAALYADDGFAMQNGSDTARGRDAIAQKITRPGGALQLTAHAYATDGDVGYIVGSYRYPETRGPGGRFVLALRMGPDNRWLIAADLDNAPPRR
jgi:ketosteroid isomerase-like protein